MVVDGWLGSRLEGARHKVRGFGLTMGRMCYRGLSM